MLFEQRGYFSSRGGTSDMQRGILTCMQQACAIIILPKNIIDWVWGVVLNCTFGRCGFKLFIHHGKNDEFP